MIIPETYKGQFNGCSTWEVHGKIFEEIFTEVSPKNILEIGFFRGSSAYMFLTLTNANVTSIDPMEDTEFPLAKRHHDGSIENTEKLKEIFLNRFSFIQKDSRFVLSEIIDKKYDLIYIDGSHLSEFVYNDLNLALTLKIPYVILDDYIGEVEETYRNHFSSLFKSIKVFKTKDFGDNFNNAVCFAKML